VRTGRPLSAGTIKSTLAHLKAFFEWLTQEPGYRASVKPRDAAWFKASDNLDRIASGSRYKPFASIDQIESVLRAMPSETEIERRDRALIAFAILSGARDAAIVTFKIKDIDLENRFLDQDARHVETKRRKTFPTWFFPVGDFIEGIVVEWVTFLRRKKGSGPEDPLFPKPRIESEVDIGFHNCGIGREHWSNANAVRRIFREAFAHAGQQYYRPHSFRDSLTKLAYDLKLNAEQLKAWSQNYGHDSCLTTIMSYGVVAPGRQAELLRDLAVPRPAPLINVAPELLRQMADWMENEDRSHRIFGD
jgi:integrase